jgi:FlaG/FlaF family flagellin (archaellin)
VKRIALVLALVAMIMATLGSGLAAADPLNSPQADTVTLTCTNGQTYQVVRQGGLPQLHIVGSTGNFILTEITFTAIDPDTGEILFSGTESIGQGNKAGLQGELITCTAAPETLEDPATGKSFTFVVTAEGFLTPRGR